MMEELGIMKEEVMHNQNVGSGEGYKTQGSVSFILRNFILAIKRHFGILPLSIVLLFTLPSCSDEDPHDYLEEKEAYADAKSLYVNTVATLYNYIGGKDDSQGLQGTARGVWDYNTFTTDEAISPTRGGDWYDGGYWQNLYLHQWTEDDNELYDMWKYLYKVVILCNGSLATLDAHDDLLSAEELEAYQAEVRAIRAMYYYYLMDLFGRVPLVVKNGVTVNDVKQANRSETFWFVVKELQEVAPLLVDAHSNQEGKYYGRVTRPVAYFLLAKLALNANIYTDDNWTDNIFLDGKDIDFPIGDVHMNAYDATVVYCNLLDACGYRLANNYADNFVVTNENSPENIFVIPIDRFLYTNVFENIARSCHYSHGGALGLNASNGPSATLTTVNTFYYGSNFLDKRYAINFYSDTVRVKGELIVLDDGKPLVYMPLAIKLDVTGSPYEKTAGARMAKYEVDNTKLDKNDIVLFRYGDALLMEAEALFRNGKSGVRALNDIRRRAGMPEVAEMFEDTKEYLPFLLSERLRELVWEGWRRQDLIRFGQFHEGYDMRPKLPNEDTRYTTVFPIPQAALELNHNLTQNPGY